MSKDIRTCDRCRESMQEWYIYENETYCSDQCLPIPVEKFIDEYEDDWDNCWTQWETIYLDD